MNAYDQEGDYFVAAFTTKPTVQEIQKALGCNGKLARHIHKGGGRTEDNEDLWYYLTSISKGERYLSEHTK